MSRDVLTVGSTMRISLLYRGEYSQWVERFMNYLEEQTYEEAMINSIKNGDQPLSRVTQVSIAGTTSTEQPPLKDKSMCVRIPKNSGVIWKKKWSSNTSNVALSTVSVLNLNKNVKRYSRKDLLACNNSVRISPVSKMPFRKKLRDSMNVHSKSNLNKSLPRTVHKWLPKMQPLVEPVAKWFPRIVQICLWIIDSGCSKHMTGNRALLTNFVEKFLGTVRFGNNDFAVIAGYRDVDLEVAFRKSTCFVRNEDGVDLLTGDRSSNLYTIALNEVASNSSTCLLAKASSSQSWLWHQRLSHLNFATINNLVKNNLVQGLPKMKFKKDHLCSACEQRKIHQKHHKSKMAFALNKPLYLLDMDLCGPMRVESIYGKRYVLVAVNDYSRYTWRVRTDNGTEFKNKTLAKFFDEDVGKLKAKGDIRVFVRYSKETAAFRIYNKRTRKSSNPSVSQVFEASKKDLEDLFHNFYNEYFDSSKIMKSSTTNVETSINEEVFHEVSESFQGESSSSSLNDDIQQSLEEVGVPSSNT
nr:hypothetical protein [Tanacetum cinerariifolium]